MIANQEFLIIKEQNRIDTFVFGHLSIRRKKKGKAMINTGKYIKRISGKKKDLIT